MHLQIRTSLGTASGTSHGSGAMSLVPTEIDPLELRRGALAELLGILADEDFDLAMASGDSIEGGGEFVFAIKGEDEAAEEDRVNTCATMLRERGYRNVRIVEPQHFDVSDQKGALRDVIQGLTDDGLVIDEVFVGVAQDGTVPIQVTTIRTID
jgi:hypothetical protein